MVLCPRSHGIIFSRKNIGVTTPPKYSAVRGMPAHTSAQVLEDHCNVGSLELCKFIPEFPGTCSAPCNSCCAVAAAVCASRSAACSFSRRARLCSRGRSVCARFCAALIAALVAASNPCAAPSSCTIMLVSCKRTRQGADGVVVRLVAGRHAFLQERRVGPLGGLPGRLTSCG